METELDTILFKWDSSNFLNMMYKGWVKFVLEKYLSIPESDRLPKREIKKRPVTAKPKEETKLIEKPKATEQKPKEPKE